MTDSDQIASHNNDRATAAGDADIKLRYRLLTGQDTAEFCERVSEALDQGYQLYGSPALTFDPDQGTRVVAQALVLPPD